MEAISWVLPLMLMMLGFAVFFWHQEVGMALMLGAMLLHLVHAFAMAAAVAAGVVKATGRTSRP
jgi:hypothetical protein